MDNIDDIVQGFEPIVETSKESPVKAPKKAKAKAAAKPKAKPAKKATPKKKPAKKAVKKTAKKAVKKTGGKPGAKRKAIKVDAKGKPINSWAKRKADPRKETLLAEAFRLMKRKLGATREELIEVLGWKAVSPQQITGNAVKVDKSERPFRYKLAA